MKQQVRRVAQLMGHRAAIYAIERFRAPHLLLSGAGDGWIVSWDLTKPKDGELLVKVEGNIFSLSYLPEKNWLVVGNMTGGVHWVDLETQKSFKNVQAHQKGVYGIQQTKDWLYTLGGAGALTRWDVAQARPVETLELSGESLRAVAYSAKRGELAIGASDNSIYLLDEQSLELRKTIKNAHDNSVFALTYSPCGEYLLSGGRDAHLRVWSISNDFQPHKALAAHWFTINHIAYHPQGHLFATASRDKTVRIWNSATFKPVKTLDLEKSVGHFNSVNYLHWADYKNYLISAGDDRTLIVWDME